MIYGSRFDQELGDLCKVFLRARKAGMKFKPKKYKLFQRREKYFCHIISAERVKRHDDKIPAVRDWPVPTKLKEFQSFLGTATYYWKFEPSFASIGNPLTLTTMLFKANRRQMCHNGAIPILWNGFVLLTLMHSASLEVIREILR